MAIVLTPEQEKRIHAVVEAGSFPSAEKAIDAAVSVIEATSSFEGDPGELESLIQHGLNSPEMSESDFWRVVDQATQEIADAHRAGRRG